MIENGYHELPAGRMAAVVTYLEMRSPAPLRPAHPEGCSIRAIPNPTLDSYRRLFREVGEPWLWFSRLRMSDGELRALLHSPKLELFTLQHQGVAKGLLELDRRGWPDLELDFFGLAPEMIGKGAGRYLMNFAIERAFSHKPERFFLHTCTLDHPAALSFYIRSGFRPYKRAVEVFDDPRVTGALPRSAGPHCPIIEPKTT
jgi:GNAT superfamily N-acetyltransferase